MSLKYHSHLQGKYTDGTPTLPCPGPGYVLARASDMRMSIKRDQRGQRSGLVAPLLGLAWPAMLALSLSLLELPGTLDLSYL